MAKPKSESVNQGAAVEHEAPVDLGALYHEDRASWALKNIEALSSGDGAVDLANLIRELEFIAADPATTWTGNCRQVIRHMQKIVHWDENPKLVFGMKGWLEEIRDYRRHMRVAVNRYTGMKSQLQGYLDELWGEGCGMAAEDLEVRKAECGDTALLNRAAELDRQRDEKCPWSLIEVAGYNTETQDKKLRPSWRILPPPVAERLNQVLELDEERAFNTSGWKE